MKELEGMGFSHNKAVRAVYHSGGGGSESAVHWLMEHEQDADIEQPLLVTKVRMPVCVCVCVCVCACVCLHVCMCMCVCMYIWPRYVQLLVCMFFTGVLVCTG